MPHPDDPSRSVTVQPRLDPDEQEVLRGLAGRGTVRRVWAGQPGRRSPWLPCRDGCCLVAEPRPARDLAAWLRFLIREVLSPRAAVPVTRARELGLPGGHRLSGRVVVERAAGSRLVVVSNNRVRELSLGEGGQRTER